MLAILLEPFQYDYMVKAMIASATVGCVCAFLSAYLMLRGWSLIGDALSHAVVPGVATVYIIGLPFTLGAFVSGITAAFLMLGLSWLTHLRQDAIIGFVFTSFFALGLFLISIYPTQVDIKTIIFGNMVGIDSSDLWQIMVIALVCLVVLSIKWKDFMLLFFDENQAASMGISIFWMKIIFFTLLSACTIASLKAVGAVLVITLIITPGATAYLLTDKFGCLVIVAMIIGVSTAVLGCYISYFFDGVMGATIVVIQFLVFSFFFLFAPKHGLITRRLSCRGL